MDIKVVKTFLGYTAAFEAYWGIRFNENEWHEWNFWNE